MIDGLQAPADYMFSSALWNVEWPWAAVPDDDIRRLQP